MNNSLLIRAAALYLPIVCALIAGALQRRRLRLFASCLLSALWTAPTLLALQQLNLRAGWWSYTGDGVLFRGMPLELYLGWVVLWGILPQLVFCELPIWACPVPMVALDLVAMPLLKPVLWLNRGWPVGEAVAAAMVLLPALCVARWTLEDSHLRMRAAMQAAISAMLFLYLVPELAFALRPGLGWTPLLELPGWQRQLALQVLMLLAVPGLSAVQEFAERGFGTPIPYDPPKRLVISGIYRYCANPMQLSCTLVMAGGALLLRNGWLLLAAAISLIYSAGIAEWDEHQDLAARFGADWRQYRKRVRSWLLRWRPYHLGAPAQIYVAASCGPCSELRSWIEARNPLGLKILDAETLPGSIRRMRYDPADGSASVDGIRALGRALEHLNLGWAFAGCVLRLPLVWQCVQLLADASGFGPRRLPALSNECIPLPSSQPRRIRG
jgi:protein-S-isoprenylcysteine O-methyltransferase Ste14